MSAISSKVVGAGRGGFSAEFRIEGLEGTLAALRALAPEIHKSLLKSFRIMGRRIAAEAEGMAPPSAAGGYGVTLRQRGFEPGLKVFAKAGSSAGRNAAIFEFAGTRMQSRDGGPITGQGAGMVRWLDGYGKPGRFLWYAWDSYREQAMAEIKTLMGEAELVVQARLNEAGEEF